MSKKPTIAKTMAILASAGFLATGCSDKDEQNANRGTSGSSQNQFGSSYEPGIGNYPDTQGSSQMSGTGYYDTAQAGVAGSRLDTASGYTTDTINIKAKVQKSPSQKSKRTNSDTVMNDRTGIDSTYSPATGPGMPGGTGGSGTGSPGGTGTGGSGTGGTGGGLGAPQGGSPSGSGAGGY